MKNTQLAFLITLFFSISAHSLPIYETVTPGEFFSINFKFKIDTGAADVLMANGGATSLGVLGSKVDLFVNNKLLASWINPMANTFAVFKESGSYFTAWGATADLSDIFDGANARIEFRPIFDALAANAHIDYQLTSFGAAHSLINGTLSDLIEPAIKSYGVFSDIRAAVPEPDTLPLLLAGMAVLAITRRKRTV